MHQDNQDEHYNPLLNQTIFIPQLRSVPRTTETLLTNMENLQPITGHPTDARHFYWMKTVKTQIRKKLSKIMMGQKHK